MKRLSLFLSLLCMVLTVNALDKRQTQINTIKKSKEYLYSDITMLSQEGAVSQAFEELQQEIFSWVSDRAEKKEGITVSPRDINKLIDTIMVRRAEMYRVFAYVKKLKLVSFYGDYFIVMDETLDCDDGHLPVVPEAPVIVDSVQVRDSVKVGDSVDACDSANVRDSVANETVVSEKVRTLLRNNFLGRKDGVIEQIKKAKNFFELKKIMEPLKQRGEILDYGKFATAKNPEDCYLIIYDPAGNIKALLGKGDVIRKNLKTGKDDSIDNYHGCGAIWFTIKAPSDSPQRGGKRQ